MARVALMAEQRFCKPQVIGSNPVSSSSGGIAQLVEHLLCKQNVIGSNPVTSTNGEVVELVYTTDLKSVGGPSHAGSNPAFATMKVKKCPKCGRYFPDTHFQCPRCGWWIK